MRFRSTKKNITYYTEAGKIVFRDHMCETDDPEKIKILESSDRLWEKVEVKNLTDKQKLFKAAQDAGWEDTYIKSTKKDLQEFLDKE